ncbi:MAG TPA: hypothetical protein VLE95_00025 [Chlamydiales bacterium]|nr:hypothetical protein [Chlamydiales bacterium]
MHRWMFFVLLPLAGCFQTYSDDENLHTVPVTNNPHIVPNHGSSIPMIGGLGNGPY